MKKTFTITRRSFLSRCSAAAAATGLPLWFVQKEMRAAAEATTNAAPVTSPNDRPRIALVGCGGQGSGDAHNAARYGDVVAVCDVDHGKLDRAVKGFTKDGKSPERYNDFRKVMERADVDIVIQGTPDHWHTLVNIAAARAKKDIYGEKPLTLTIDEGRHVIKAVRENKVVFQTGTQQRSSSYFHLACELVRNGRIGKIKQVDVFVPRGLRAGSLKKISVPDGFNYDFWLGQAPLVPYYKERCDHNFRWWFDYAGGPVTDWGAHHNDIARWALGLDGPTSVEARVVLPPLPDGFTTPALFEAQLTWANGIVQNVRTTPDDEWNGAVINEAGQRNGIKFIGSNGWIWVNRDGIEASDKQLLTTPLPDNAIKLEVSKNHMGNFFDCVRSRQDPISNVEGGHRSASVGHLIIIGLQTGQKLQWNPEKEIFTGANAAAGNKLLAREMRAPYDYSFLG